MAILSAVSAIFSVIGGLKGDSDAKSAARDQERLAQENAMNIEAETQESSRRAGRENDKAQAEMRAKASASGTRGDGSQSTYIDDEQKEFNKQNKWLRKSGSNQASITRKAGKNAANVTRSKGKQALWGGVGKGIASGGSAYKQYKTNGGWGY